MKKNNTLKLTIPIAIVFIILAVYQYGYLNLKAEIDLIKEKQAMGIKTFSKYMQTIADKPELEKRLAALKEKRKEQTPKLIEGQTIAVASSSLMDMVKNIISAKGGTIHGQRIDKPEDAGKFKTISVNIGSTIPDTRALNDILYAIKTNVPYLAIKELDVRVQNFRDPRQLMLNITISALTEAK
jgi:hypothetical protein